MLNFNVLYTSFIPYTYCINLSKLIDLPILLNIINVITLCLIKEPFKIYYLLIYLLFRVLIYILNLFTLPIWVLISIFYNFNMSYYPYILWLTNIITAILLCNWRTISVFNVMFWTIKSFESLNPVLCILQWHTNIFDQIEIWLYIYSKIRNRTTWLIVGPSYFNIYGNYFLYSGRTTLCICRAPLALRNCWICIFQILHRHFL